MHDENELLREPIPRLIRQLTVPVSIGMFFSTMYNVVDTYFGGMISTEALAAMSLSLPVFFIIISFGSGMGTGTTALIGAALGANDRREARLYGFQGISFAALMSVVLAAAGRLLSPVLFRLLGASDEYLRICMQYMTVLFDGATFFMIVYMLNAVLNAQGDTRSFRNFLILGFLLNVGLDPWFISGGLGVPALGVTGIALATVLVQLIGCAYLGYRVHQSGLLAGACLRDLRPQASAFREIARQGFPASLNIMTIALGVFVITYFISRFGREAVAAYGIGMRIEQLVLLPALGFNTATLTLSAQNHGAGLHDRVHDALHLPLKYGAVMMSLGGVLVYWAAPVVMGWFTDDRRVITIGVSYLRVEAMVFYAYVVLFVCVAALQGLKRPMFAIYIGLYRQIAAPFLLFYLLTTVWGLGIRSIWWAILAVTWSAAAIAFFYARRAIGGGKQVAPVTPIP